MIQNLNCKKGVAIVLAGLLLNVSAKSQTKGYKGLNGLTRQEGLKRGSFFSELGLGNILQTKSIFDTLPGVGPRFAPRSGSGSKGKQFKKKLKSSKKSPKSSSKVVKSPDYKPSAGDPSPGGPGKKGPKTVINNFIVDSTVQNVNVTNNNSVNITAGGDINGDINITQNGPITEQTSTKNNTIQNTYVSSKTGSGILGKITNIGK